MAVFYNPPANINDYDRRPALSAALKQDWHDFIAAGVGARDKGLFYDASNDPAPQAPANRVPISWNAFPRSIMNWFNGDSDPAGLDKALAAADVLRSVTAIITGGGVRFTSLTPQLPPLRRVENGTLGDQIFPLHRQQDEYCEWHVDRDANQRITRISYTAEGPEYWQRMARRSIGLVVELYQEFVNSGVQQQDIVWPFDVAAFNRDTGGFQRIFRMGDYNPYNRFNTTEGVMHLTHPANTLGAEINLGADATVLRPVPLQPANTLPERLICCAQYGGVNRSSDPAIGAGVNGLARSGKAVTLANPIGLYISSIGIDGLREPNNNPIGQQALKVRRSSADGSMKLRVEVVIPPGATFTLDQCKFDQKKLDFGGQIARKITMVLFGQGKTIPGRTAGNQPCESKCCNKPDAPNFIALVGTGTNCSQLPAGFFDEDAPVTQQTGVVDAFAAEAEAAPLGALDLDAPEPTQVTRRAPLSAKV